jgi:hypothetical protein
MIDHLLRDLGNLIIRAGPHFVQRLDQFPEIWD